MQRRAGAPQQASVATGADPAGAPMPPVKASPTLQMPERAVPAPGEVAPAAVQEPYKSKVPALEESLVGQLSRDEQEMLKTKHKAAEEADKKVLRGSPLGQEGVEGILLRLLEQ